MALTSAQYAALKAELANDPAALGLAAPIAAGQMEVVAGLLNASRAGQSCRSGTLTLDQILGAITLTELPAGQDGAFLAWVNMIRQTAVGFDLNNAKVAAVFQRFFLPATASYTALAALRTVTPCSRAQALFGVQTLLAWSDIVTARNS